MCHYWNKALIQSDTFSSRNTKSYFLNLIILILCSPEKKKLPVCLKNGNNIHNVYTIILFFREMNKENWSRKWHGTNIFDIIQKIWLWEWRNCIVSMLWSVTYKHLFPIYNKALIYDSSLNSKRNKLKRLL